MAAVLRSAAAAMCCGERPMHMADRLCSKVTDNKVNKLSRFEILGKDMNLWSLSMLYFTPRFPRLGPWDQMLLNQRLCHHAPCWLLFACSWQNNNDLLILLSSLFTAVSYGEDGSVLSYSKHSL